MNECTENSHVCEHTCQNTIGSHTCTCHNGYILNTDGITCRPVLQCLDQTKCNQECTRINNVDTCHCFNGYEETTPGNCQDVNECERTELDHCQGVAQCQNTEGSYDCSCPTGYVIVGNDARSCQDVDECSQSTHRCEHSCENNEGGYDCVCNEGYAVDDLYSCRDINECVDDSLNFCRGVAECQNTIGSHSCTCPSGYQLKQDRRSCDVIVPTIPTRAVTEHNVAALRVEITNLVWEDALINMLTTRSQHLADLVSAALGRLYENKVGEFVRVTEVRVVRFSQGSVFVEHEVITNHAQLEPWQLAYLAQALRDTMNEGITIGGDTYPVRATTFMLPDGTEVAITNDCAFYNSIDACSNGAMCIMDGGAATCQCGSDTEGQFCEMKSEGANLKLIVPVVVIGVLFLVGLIVIAVWGSRKARANNAQGYVKDTDTASLAGHSANQSDISTGKQHGPRIHTWWPGNDPHAASVQHGTYDNKGYTSGQYQA